MPCGNPKDDGSTCQQPEGWGREADEGPCKYHADDGESVGSVGSRAGDGGGLDYANTPFGELQVERILSALRDGATYEIAARSAGASARTFLRWRQKYPALEDKVKRAEAESATETLSRLQKAAKNGDTATMRWIMEKRHGYDSGNGEFSEEDVDLMMDAMKAVLREHLPEDKVDEIIIAMGDELEEVEGAKAI